MKLKTLAFAVVILALVSAAAYFANRPEKPPSADPKAGKPVLDADIAAKAVKMVVVSDQGKALTLVRQSDGTWKVPDYFDMTGDFSKISRFVEDMNNAKVERFVTANPERISRLEFTGAKVRLLDGADKEIWSLALGKNSESGSGRFVQFGSDPKVYLTGLHLWLDTEAKGWTDQQLVNVKPDDVAKIDLPLEAGGSITLTRKTKSDPWTPADPAEKRKVKADAVSTVLSSLGTLRFSDTTAPDDAGAAEARKHLKTYVLTTFGGQSYSVSLGRKPEEKKLKAPVADAASGPASLGKISDLKSGEKSSADSPPSDSKQAETKPAEAKPAQPEFETIPAGPWFAVVTSSDPHAAINDLMKKRSFQVEDYSVSSLPKTKDDLLEAAPTPAAVPAPAPAAAPAPAPTSAPASAAAK